MGGPSIRFSSLGGLMTGTSRYAFPLKLLAITVFSAALGIATSSFAASFTGTVTLESNADQDPALVVVTTPGLGTPSGEFFFNLNAQGQTHVINNLFQIGTNECCFNWDDFNSRAFTASFDFSAPDFNGDVSGQTFGVLVGGILAWNGAATLPFGNGGLLQITLANVFFPLNFDGGNPNWVNVGGTFTLLAAPSAVPLPAALPLLAGGLGGLGVMSWWRRRKERLGSQ